MTIYRSSDSLSKCDPNLYSGFYDARKRADHILRDPAEFNGDIRKDTIEISRSKLKKDAQNYLKYTSYIISQNHLMRIGKYALLAIVFPPYLLLYGIPKWILVEGFPLIFSIWLKRWKKFQHQAQKYFFSLCIVRLSEFIKRMTHVFLQPFVDCCLKMSQSIRYNYKSLCHFFRNISKSLTDSLNVCFLMISRTLKMFRNALLIIKKKQFPKILALVSSLLKGIQQTKNKLPIWKWKFSQFRRYNRYISSQFIKWKNHFQASQKWAEDITNICIEVLKQTIDRSKFFFNPLIHFYQKECMSRWHLFKEACQKRCQQACDFFKKNHRRALAFIQLKQKKLKERLVVKNFLQNFIFYSESDRLSFNLKKWMKQVFLRPVTLAFYNTGIKIYAFLTHHLLQLASFSLQFLAKGGLLIIGCLHSFQAIFRLITQQILEILKIGLNFLSRSFLVTFYYSLLMAMIIFLLITSGMRYLEECTTLLISNLSFKR